MRPKEEWRRLFVDPQVYTAASDLPDPSALKIYDTTLRDGEQMPGVAMSPYRKYEIAKELSRIGVHIVDLCFPTVSDGERKLLQLTLQGKEKGEIREDMEVLVMCRASKKDVDATIKIVNDAGFPADSVTFLIFTSASNLHVKYKLGTTLMKREGLDPEGLRDTPLELFHEANKRMVHEAISYAVDRGVEKIEFGGEDASRTPVEQLIDLVRSAVDAGACRYVFADTTGSLTPEATRLYCSALTAAFPGLERVSHFHDDFGLAAANTIAGILNGFTTFTTTINGIGERAGNAPMHSVVASLRYLYGLEVPGFQYERLGHIRQVVEDATGVPVAAKEPVIGRNVFTHESGIHTHGVGIHRGMYEPIPYEDVGGKGRFVYGKHSGKASLVHLLKKHEDEFDREIDPSFVSEVLEEIKRVRTSNIRSFETKSYVENYYSNLDKLGFNESEVVLLARGIAYRDDSQRKTA